MVPSFVCCLLGLSELCVWRGGSGSFHALASEIREGRDKVCSGCLAPAPATAGVQVGGVGLI